MRRCLVAAAVGVAMAMAGGAMAAEVEVKMLNKGAEGLMVFEPALIKVAPGDYRQVRVDRQEPQCRDHQGHASGRWNDLRQAR